jgi:hypothetical protein
MVDPNLDGSEWRASLGAGVQSHFGAAGGGGMTGL